MSENDELTKKIEIELEDEKENFKKIVLLWVNLDEKIKDINIELKNLRNEKKQYEEMILNFMTKYNENIITLSNCLLKKNVSTTKSAIKEEMIQNTIEEYTKDLEEAYNITQKIINKREINEKITLKKQLQKK